MTRAWIVREAAARLTAAGIPADEARQEARALVGFALNISREAFLLSPETELTPAEADAVDAVIARRAAREPFAYITGIREFYGLPFRVTPAVLIPRPETELLVDNAREFLAGHDYPSVVDVGTGSGCIAVALAVHVPQAAVCATDISPDALAVAKENATRNGAVVAFRQGDLLAPVADLAPFDAILSNPPYIAPEEITHLEPEVRDWEPGVALGIREPPGWDPLHFYYRFAAEAPPLLKSGGLLAVEVGQGQAESVAGLWRDAGFANVRILPDLAGIGRVVRGHMPQT